MSITYRRFHSLTFHLGIIIFWRIIGSLLWELPGVNFIVILISTHDLSFFIFFLNSCLSSSHVGSHSFYLKFSFSISCGTGYWEFRSQGFKKDRNRKTWLMRKEKEWNREVSSRQETRKDKNLERRPIRLKMKEVRYKK